MKKYLENKDTVLSFKIVPVWKNKATTAVKNLLQKYTKEEVSKMIGISRPTLDTRLQLNNWKVSEIFLISKLI